MARTYSTVDTREREGFLFVDETLKIQDPKCIRNKEYACAHRNSKLIKTVNERVPKRKVTSIDP